MLSQIEGSPAVARGGRALPARGHLRRIRSRRRRTSSRRSRTSSARASSRPCEYLMVESEFGAMSACIGASAMGARAYTATASQGLLFMAEALYNASGLGLPIVMTVANRAIGAPINIWNDHSDAMSQRDSRLDPALRRVQPGGGRPARPGIQARGGAVAAGHGLHGRLRPHPRDRGGRAPDAGAGRRLPAAVPPAAGPRPGRPGDDRSHGRAGGVHRGQVPDAREADAGSRPHPRDLRGVLAGVRAILRRARPRVPKSRTPRRSSSRSARCSGRSRRSWTSCARTASGSALSASRASAPSPLEEIRAALQGARGRRAREGVRRRRSAASSGRT